MEYGTREREREQSPEIRYVMQIFALYGRLKVVLSEVNVFGLYLRKHSVSILIKWFHCTVQTSAPKCTVAIA
jgi:hypothetical protein